MTPNLLRTYARDECAIVYKTREAFGGLSNMAAGYPLQVNGADVLTSEALYQACRFPGDPEVQQEIIRQHSPMTAKMVSRQHHQKTRPDWDAVRPKVMRWCLRVKLAQHYEAFGQLLLSTGHRPIVEQSRKDDYWGAKLAGDAGDTLIGQNVLGRLLMELREELRADAEGPLRTACPPGIPCFLLFGVPVEDVAAQATGGGARRLQHTLF